MAMYSTQPLKEVSAINLSGGKARPACRAENLTDNFKTIAYKSRMLDIVEPYRSPGNAMGVVLSCCCNFVLKYFF
jgi:hypothetical protein